MRVTNSTNNTNETYGQFCNIEIMEQSIRIHSDSTITPMKTNEDANRSPYGVESRIWPSRHMYVTMLYSCTVIILLIQFWIFT